LTRPVVPPDGSFIFSEPFREKRPTPDAARRINTFFTLLSEVAAGGLRNVAMLLCGLTAAGAKSPVRMRVFLVESR
jgi:hypothetical protein